VPYQRKSQREQGKNCGDHELGFKKLSHLKNLLVFSGALPPLAFFSAGSGILPGDPTKNMDYFSTFCLD
jgi:hypothetical protein